MLILMQSNATRDQVQSVLALLEQAGVRSFLQESPAATSILAPNASQVLKPDRIEPMGGVHRVVPITTPFKLASADAAPGRTVVTVRGVPVGGRDLAVMAGPCGVESGSSCSPWPGTWPRAESGCCGPGPSSPAPARTPSRAWAPRRCACWRKPAGSSTWASSPRPPRWRPSTRWSAPPTWCQVGARNMQNFALLKRAGRCSRPVLLKRGPAATLEEWLFAAEYVLSEGNRNVILCERGIRTWSQHARNTLDVSVIPAAKLLTHLPVIADPSHATGRRDLVVPCARAAVAAGADGLIVETHCQPERALSDGPQALLPWEFQRMLEQVQGIRAVLGRDGTGGFRD